MKYYVIFIVAILFAVISCGDDTGETGEVNCPVGSFYHDSGNCINPCEGVDCGDGECTGISAVKYECTKPACVMPKVYNELNNTCGEPCENIDCGDGECVVVTETEVKCEDPVCETGSFVNENNRCINPCDNIDCGTGLICQGIDSESFDCVANCSNPEGYFEENRICVNPCYNVDCGLGSATCISESAIDFHCECDDEHELVNGKCRRPLFYLFKKYADGENNQEEAIAFHDLNLENGGGFGDNHDPHYNGYDMVFNESETQFILGNFEYGDFRLNRQNEPVSLYVWSYTDENPSWKYLADTETCDNDQGHYDADHFCAVEGKGGMINYDIPQAQKLPVGLHLIKLYMKKDGVSTSMYIRVKPDNEQLKMVVFDMDGTLTTDDSEVTLTYVTSLWNGERDMEMYPGAPSIAKYYYQRGYEIIYVTARPYWLTEMSYEWLVEKGFPRGLTHAYEGAIPDGNFDAETYKKGYLESLTNKGVDFSFTYGNALTDIAAYKYIGTPCNKIFIIGEHAGKDCSTAVEDYPYHLTKLPE